MATTELFRSPVQNLGQDFRAYTIVVVSSTGGTAAATNLEGEIAFASTSAFDSATAEPLKAHARDIRWEMNWLPGVHRGTVNYVGLRTK